MGGSITSGSSSTSKSGIPKWMDRAGQDIYGKAKSFYEKPYQQYTGQRVAPFSADSLTGFQNLRNYVANAPDISGEATGLVRGASNLPAQRVEHGGRIVDEGGPLGKMSDYMNPFVEASLNPTLRELGKTAQTERMRVGDLASSGGAYNDARHGILERGVNQDLNTAVGDATARAYTDAFNQAMGFRAGDMGRMYDASVTNAGLAEQAAGRQMTGAGAMMDIQGARDDQFFNQISSLLSSGQAQQQHEQTKLDVPYTEFEKKKQDEYDRLAALVSVIGGLPYSRTTTTQNNDGGAGFLGAIGSILGAVI